MSLSEIRVNTTKTRTGVGTIPYTETGPVITGIATASNFKTGSTNVHSTGVELSNINTGGSTATFGGAISGTTASFSGTVSIGGTLTYEDVTNIDSVGILTARAGIRVTGGDIGIGVATPSTKLSLEGSAGSTSHGILIGPKHSGGIRGVVEVHSAADTIGFNLSRTGGGSDTDIVLLRNVSSSGVIEARNASNASKIYLNSGGSSYFTGGNIGINSTAPSQKLDVMNGKLIGKH